MDDVDVAVNSVDLALEHPDLITDLEPSDLVLEHPDILPPLEGVDDIISEHPKVAFGPIEIELEPTDLVLEHPKVVIDPECIEAQPDDIVLEHPTITRITKDIDVDPEEIALEHAKVAVGPKYIKVEPIDLASEHPKIVTRDFYIEPNELAIEHSKVVNPTDLDLEPSDLILEHPKVIIDSPVKIEPDDLVLEHPKVAIRDTILKVEPTDLAIDHPKIATKIHDIGLEPTEIAIEHPKVALKYEVDLEPNDVVLEHPKIVKRLDPTYVEPKFVITEHPKILRKFKEIDIEPTDIAIEHPKIAKEAKVFNVEPSDILTEHPDLANSANEDIISPWNQKSNSTKPRLTKKTNTDSQRSVEESKTTSPSFGISGNQEQYKTKMDSNSDPMNFNDPRAETISDYKLDSKEEPNPSADSTGYFKGFKPAEKMAEEQIKRPEMNIDSVEIVPRRMWNAAEPKYKLPLNKPITHVLATYTGTEPCWEDNDCKRIIQNLQIKQMEEMNLPDIQWNFMIGGTGKVYEGRGFDTVATKPPHYEKEAQDSLDIAYIGNNEEEEMHPQMFATLNGLVASAMDEGHVTKPFIYLQDSPQYRKVMQLR